MVCRGDTHNSSKEKVGVIVAALFVLFKDIVNIPLYC
jgi:hypothetical protein